MKQILFTSDDFGMTHSVNLGILQGFQKGVLGSTNLMTPCPWFPDAVKIAKQNNISCGVHLTITCDWDNMKWGPRTHAPSLCTPEGYFHNSYQALAKHATDEDLRKELRQQIKDVIQHGITPTHLDSHMISMNSEDPFQRKVLQITSELAREFNLYYHYEREKPHVAKFFDSEFELSTNSEEDLYQHLQNLGDGLHHVICHCSLDTQEQQSLVDPNSPIYSWSAPYRIHDLDIICSPKLKQTLEQLQFQVLQVQDLPFHKQKMPAL